MPQLYLFRHLYKFTPSSFPVPFVLTFCLPPFPFLTVAFFPLIPSTLKQCCYNTADPPGFLNQQQPEVRSKIQITFPIKSIDLCLMTS